MRCETFDAAVEELALGHVAEPDRSALLDHAGGCARCAGELAEVLAVTDQLLELAPQVEPPVGFEQRVAAVPVAVPGRRRRRSAWLVAAAAAGLALVYLPGVVRGDRPLTVEAAVLDADGDPAGTITIEEDELVLMLDGEAHWPGTWSCELRDGERWVRVGTWTAADVVDGAWSIEVDADVADGASAMRVRSGRGDVLYTAALG